MENEKLKNFTFEQRVFIKESTSKCDGSEKPEFSVEN